MNNFFRGIIAAWGAKKLGGGCLSTIIIFAIIYSLLGKCNSEPRRVYQPIKGNKQINAALSIRAAKYSD